MLNLNLALLLQHHEPPARRVRIICKDNYKYEMAPPEMRQSLPPHDGNGGQQTQQPLQPQQQPQQQQPQLTETVASITNSGANQGANHHMIQHHTRPVSTMAPHHPLHPHHVQAAHGGPAVHLHTGHPHGLVAPAPCKLFTFFVDCRQGGGGYQKSRKLGNVLNEWTLS